MAANGERDALCAGSKQKQPGEQISHDTGHLFKECVVSILDSVAEFGTKLKVGEGVLNITVSVDSGNISGLQPSHVYTCLQQYILKLQSISENLKQIEVDSNSPVPGTSESTLGCRQETAETCEQMEVDTVNISPTSQHCGVHEDRNKTDDNVQIKAGKSEIERRISAFIERKQLEINENNVREFCNVIDCNQEDSCARTDAVFTPYPGFKSHVKVTRVVNTYGPQTRKVHIDLGDHQQGSINRDCGNPAIEERLHNMEAHLKLPPAGPVPQSVYQRLKKLEDRILELEGLSPEYFHSTNYSHKRPKTSVSQNCSLAELDGKISAVKAALLKKTSVFQPTDTGEFPY
ncbi:MAP3K12-binding inhibitory protein 1 MAPK upstream kinase-binding inhibitory protein [Triplophysa tibetana]|uniref:MAP3K12-binding inhibitory protein 1 MAPK upstream kinase-binding inhibitory protein n=1 Tax=Triplophysa tibetana TaxID=1572043 RepID=A0A5A9NNR0_9TELE|nr:MAP3K12-binding inhibitory protein 1 MAPK upstream kinase-binding inhibitory protein [Triplophysa tibetana]